MKKCLVKAIGFLMIFAILTSCCTVAFAASDVKSSSVSSVKEDVETYAHRTLYNIGGKIVSGLCKAINSIFPGPKWQNEEDYVSENFYEGTTTFLNTPAKNAKWSLGYDSASILTDDVLDGKHFVAGGITLKKKLATEIVDDSKVRTVAMNDGSGRGTVVFAVLDAYGLANNDVREIRARLQSFAKENNIVSINVSVLHQHSVVDTLGMNGDIVKAVFVNPFINLLGLNVPLSNGKNASFMENLFETTKDSIISACENMKTGKMLYSKVDVTDYIVDKRPPQALDTNMERLRFVPDDGSKETYIATSVIHCVGNGVQGTQVTADYPYYMEQYVNEKADANFMLMLGAELSTSQNHNESTGCTDDMTRLQSVAAFGKSLGKKLVDMNTTETEIAPLLNIRSKEVSFVVDNQIILIAAKSGLFTNKVVKSDEGYKICTEIGYMELGTNLAVALIPGELEAAIAYGGALEGKDAWSYKDWTEPSLQELVGNDRELLIFGLSNDQIGYIVPDNDFMPMLAPESKSVEFVSIGASTASTLVGYYKDLIGSVE